MGMEDIASEGRRGENGEVKWQLFRIHLDMLQYKRAGPARTKEVQNDVERLKTAASLFGTI